MHCFYLCFVKDKRVWFRVQLLFLFLITSKLYANDNLDEVQISVANFPPYINEVEQTGVIVGLVKNVFLEQGIKTNISFSTWSEVETAVDRKNHLSFMWSKTAKRKRKWSYSEPVYTNRQVIVSNKSKRVFWRRLDELRQYKIGVTTHHNYGKRFEDYREFLDLNESISDFISLKKLINGKFDAIVLEELNAQHLLSYFPKSKQEKIEILSHQAIDTSDSYLVCSKMNSRCAFLIDRFNQGLKKLKQTDKYSQLFKAGK